MNKINIARALRAPLFWTIVLLNDSSAYASIPSPLQNLTHKITTLQQNLSFDNYKKQKLLKQLASIEKNINENNQILQKLNQEHQLQQQKIDDIKHAIIECHQQIANIQQRLRQHILTRYKMHEATPMQWFFHAEKITEGHQLLTYYQYIIKDDQRLITEIIHKKAELIEHENLLQKDQEEQQKTTEKWQQQQQKLIQQKNLQLQLLNKLDNIIDKNQHTLSSYEKNKQQLSHIVSKLSNTSVVQTRHASFTQMRHNLPSPLSPLSNPANKFHQGVLFKAREGTPVYAVYPGKVVFADWLNGYGLLIIVDHGWGFMTLYANNKTLFKHPNDIVQNHDLIAHVGHTGGSKENGLYFEIRHYGKTISSKEWLQ